jgi:hypothetical protein
MDMTLDSCLCGDITSDAIWNLWIWFLHVEVNNLDLGNDTSFKFGFLFEVQERERSIWKNCSLSFHSWKETTKGELRDNWSKVHVFTMGKSDLSALRQIITLNNWLRNMVWSTTCISCTAEVKVFKTRKYSKMSVWPTNSFWAYTNSVKILTSYNGHCTITTVVATTISWHANCWA